MPSLFCKLSTSITIPFGPVLDSTGAEFTTLVVGEVKISKNSGTPAALNGSATLTHKEVGIYELVLTASDISAVGQVTLTCSKTTYVAPPVTLIVLPAKVYDSLVGGTDNLEVDAIQLNGVAQSLLDLKDFADDGYDPATNKVQGVVLVDSVTTVTTCTTLTNLPAITAGWLTATGIAADAITAAKIADGAISETKFAANAITAAVLDAGASAEIADAVWDELQAGHTTAGTFGKFLDVEISSISGGGGGPTAAAIADAVWDEAISGHLAAGSTGAALNAAGSAGDPWTTPLPGAYGAGTAGKIVGDNVNATVGSRATQVSVDAIAAKTTNIPTDPADASDIAASFTTVNNTLATIQGFIDTEVAAIKAKTDQLSFTNANKVDAAILAAADIAAAVCTKLAAIIFRRTMANIEADANGDAHDLSSLYGFIQQAQESAVNADTLTVHKTDGTTVLGTKTVVPTPGADPITGIS